MSIDVRFRNETYQLVLCELSRSDPYTFLKEKLSLETCRNMFSEDIEVQQVGSNVPFNLLWPADRPLASGTYRVTIKPDGQQAKQTDGSSWPTTIHIACVDHGGYWQDVSTVPDVLHLHLRRVSASDLEFSSIQRLSAYAADERLLERPFYHQFAETDWHLDFATNTNIAGTTQEAQKRYVRTLHDRKLMLRVADLSDSLELLLRPSKSGQFLGCLKPKGSIENIAYAQYQSFINTKQLVLVLDLDGTLIHTAEGDERESFQNCQHAVELHVQDQDQSLFCIPRARLLEFFLQVIGKYYIMFCTAGSPQYAEVVITKLRETLLSKDGLTLQQQDSITRSVKPSHLVSNCYTSNRNFKSLRMMLPVAHLPDLAERLFIILDDRRDVWKREGDKKLVWQISQQKSFTSYSAPAPSLERYGALFGAIHDFIYNYDVHHRNPLPDIPAAGMQHWLRHGGQNLFAF